MKYWPAIHLTMMSHEHLVILNHWQHGCFFHCLFSLTTTHTLKLHVTGCCEGSPTVTDGFPALRANIGKSMFMSRIMHIVCILLCYVVVVSHMFHSDTTNLLAIPQWWWSNPESTAKNICEFIKDWLYDQKNEPQQNCMPTLWDKLNDLLFFSFT